MKWKTSKSQSSTSRVPLRLCSGAAHCPVEEEQSSAALQASPLASGKPAHIPVSEQVFLLDYNGDCLLLLQSLPAILEA